ncbi:axoneme-associated protein mst101(2)-like [Macrobrachium rosenbergii]|uniref:axoneme-associated protein mst101(2)-like n=1 Tax=Macrobrachium rosenbergii TaxID=79674 RepID=UPI0034D42882
MAHFSGITRRLTIILLLAFYVNTSHGLKQRRQTPEEDETFRYCGNGNSPGICFTAEKAAKYNCLSLEEDFNCPDETLCCKLSGGKSFQEEERKAAEKLFAKRSLREETDLDLEEERDEIVEKRVRREGEEREHLSKMAKRSGNGNAVVKNKGENNSGGVEEGKTDNDKNGERGEGKTPRQNVRGKKQGGNRNNKQGNSLDSRKGDAEKKSERKAVKVKSQRNGVRSPASQNGRKRGGAGRVSQSDKRENTNPGKGRNGSGKGANTNNEATAASAKKNKDLKKVSVKQSCKMTKKCKSSSGTCRTACLTGEKQKGKCKGSQCKCCITVQTASCTQTSQCSGACVAKKKDCSGIYKKGSGCTGSRKCGCCISCTATTKCNKAKGKCATKCKKSQRKVPNGCKGGASCLCCGKKCQPKAACKANGGTCVEKQTDCTGTFQANGCKFGCHCCVPSMETTTPEKTTTKGPTTAKPLPTDSSSTT